MEVVFIAGYTVNPEPTFQYRILLEAQVGQQRQSVDFIQRAPAHDVVAIEGERLQCGEGRLLAGLLPWFEINLGQIVVIQHKCL